MILRRRDGRLTVTASVSVNFPEGARMADVEREVVAAADAVGDRLRRQIGDALDGRAEITGWKAR